ncbi:MAG TPA: biopolymer transporter ExbD [Flavilitoribacter sp.]|nr:biopolymer transporter ExbD [Lewinella sp.]MCB9277488.1 biopolymer transporter ExbD [Lewinellaceae bacterium]HMQ60576.1 biopolymer transporter ExbD [Flavilitoribacter sp.]HMQ87885.1 biopolymer transporter ExbD [Flavilitoribacter sp.]
MGIKKRNKVNAQFSMSSLTDIIFLLLIFFMLTSSLVAPNALNLKLPGSSRTNVASSDRMDDVRISSSGRFYLNGEQIDLARLDGQLRSMAGRSGKQMNMTISPDSGAPTEAVVAIMDIAMRYNINGILATDIK